MAKQYKRFVDKHQSKIWSCVVKCMNDTNGLVNETAVRSLFDRYFGGNIHARQVGKSIDRFEKRFLPVIVRFSDNHKTKEYHSFAANPKIPFLHRIRFAYVDFVKGKWR